MSAKVIRPVTVTELRPARKRLITISHACEEVIEWKN
jgi:hypothetical protein